MSKMRLFSGTNARVGTFLLALMIPTAGALADVDNAKAGLDELGIGYLDDDVISADLVMNISDAVKNHVTTGELPIQYRNIVISPEITTKGADTIYQQVICKNLENYINHVNSKLDPTEGPVDFKYVSCGSMFVDNATAKAVCVELENKIQAVSLNPTKEGVNEVMAYAKANEASIPVGATKAIYADLAYLQSVVTLASDPQVAGLFEAALGATPEQLADLGETLEGLSYMSGANGNNADIITYIKELIGRSNCM